MRDPVTLEHDWFPAALPPNVVVGERSWLYSSFAFTHSRSRRPVALSVGTDTGIYNPSFFELGEDGEVEIGNFCTLVAVIIATNRRVVIGDYAFLAHDVVLADSFASTPGPVASKSNQTAPSSSDIETAISVGANSWIGARAVLLSGAHIGEGAIIGAASVVDFHVPQYAIVAGNPARIVGSSK